jgi:hypothetical protein
MRVVVRRTFGDASAPQDYQLVALPGAVDRPLAQLLEGAPGVAWQAFWDDGSDTDFLTKFDGSETFTVGPGRGFWLISTAPWAVDATVETVPLNDGSVTTVPLHDGWNIISNPLDRAVPWDVVTNANGGGLQTLWQWDGAFAASGTFRSAAAGEAFYFLNDQGLDALRIPYPSAVSRAGIPASKSIGETFPTLTLIATQDGPSRSTVRVGFAPDAEIGLDPRDQFAPPSHFEALSLHLLAPRHSQSDRLQYLAHEWRPMENGQVFDLLLRAEEGPVTIGADGLETLGDYTASLIDVDGGRAHDLNANAIVRWAAPRDSVRLRLAIGPAAFVESEAIRVVPQEVILYPVYPNPSSGQATLTYAVPERAEVHLVVYDVLGRRVRTLVDRVHQPGRHQRTWDGRNNGGERVASGVYLVRLTAEGQQHVQKVVVVR